ncbi:flagellar hook-associated protein 1 FlgK [Mariprofundus micogutta]|uniref:Flagellar hook-associated protein 1 n=1 Tax=Mariprofundus micogutta TaxID=1921010 RepID=A0A1L8CKJ5_9PROT|nr:flagellar hook-associated protein FlgK [Mariprofundus micogutta]GAV19434.1 flagellar hook-associated protein 1 FlgK [Mariprofundus micogutta]
MIFPSLNIAASALQAQQSAIDVVAHNIANANTPGYSRQVADIGTLSPEKIGGMSFGRGVQIQNVQRIIDPIINDALTNNSSQQSYWDSLNKGLNAVENVFGSLSSTGLAASLDEFFLAWQQMSNNPQDGGQKFNVAAKTNTVINNISTMSTQLSNAQNSADNQISDSLTQANLLLDKVASLNAQITRQENIQQGVVGAANDLRDQRDTALRDLAQIIPIQVVNSHENGTLVQSTNGDLLVQDNTARHLARGTVGANAYAPIVIQETGAPLSGTLNSGSIGGLVELRDNKLGSYLNQINSIASNMIFAVNQIHANGSNGAAMTSITSQEIVNAGLALNDPLQVAPFASQIQTGSFKVHTYDAAGLPTPAGGTLINITAGVTTMNDVATSISAIPGVTASIGGNGQLTIAAAAGSSFALSDDTSNVLAAYEINNFFHGSTAGTMEISANIQASANNINTGQVVSATSAILVGDSTTAVSILALQDQAITFDGTVSSSLHDRTTLISSTYGTDVNISSQQLQYRTSEAVSLNSQRESISGVNIDDELVTMIKFQRAYEASAKIITTSNQMLDSLLGLIR